jgi:hypothetical protein
LSQTLTRPPTPPYTPEIMTRRGGPEASQEYKDGNDRYAAAFRSALALVPTN